MLPLTGNEEGHGGGGVALGHILPAFRQATGIEVKVVAVGTGQALDIARRGDADALLVHDTAAEEKFVAEGFATRRYGVMYNDFVLVGPRQDPAGAQQLIDHQTAACQSWLAELRFRASLMVMKFLRDFDILWPSMCTWPACKK